MIRRPPSLLLAVCLWFLLEYGTFLLVVHFAGLSGAIFLGVVTMLIGILILRKLGRGAARRLRDALDGGSFSDRKVLDGVLSALGAIFLILPGFITDLIGLALAAPSLRQWLGRRIGGRARQKPASRPNTIDLDPQEWNTVDAKATAQPVPRSNRSKIAKQAPDTL